MDEKSNREVSVCVGPTGDAAIFVTRPESDARWSPDVARIARSLAARGLRVLGASSSSESPPDSLAGMKCGAFAPDSVSDGEALETANAGGHAGSDVGHDAVAPLG